MNFDLFFDIFIGRIRHSTPQIKRRSMRSVIPVVFSLMMVQSMLFSADFTRFSDMCEPTETQHCPNKPDEVKALQEALNANPNLYLYIKADGKWGLGTKEAVIVFQEHYGIRPAQGYVGRKTRALLQKIADSNRSAGSEKTAGQNLSGAQHSSSSARKTGHTSSVTASPTREFVLYSDMCDNTLEENHCPNKTVEVSNLQILLNADPNLNVNISADGKWGRETREAVVAFQKHYGIAPASGYVGVRTKRMLDRVAGAMVARATTPIQKSTGKQTARATINKWKDMCTKSATDNCPNRPEDVRALQAFLNRTLGLKLAVDGKWGKGTEQAAIRFQEQHHISPANGYVGRKTRTRMQHLAQKSHTGVQKR